MLAAQITQPHQAYTTRQDVPAVNADDVLIEVKSAGICGTDLHIFEGEYEATYPIVPGHEFSGVVTAIGENVSRFEVGDRVTADPNIPCNHCPACQRNEPNQCHHLQAVGVTRAGAFAEYVSVPQSNVFDIGDLSFSSAALIEPLACVVWGLLRVQVQPGDSVLVLGAGPMGCLLAQAVKAAGAAQVVITDNVPQRLRIAEQLGVSTILADGKHNTILKMLAPQGFDVVADATGISALLEQAFMHVRPRGKVWVFGVVPPDQKATFFPYEVFRKDLSIIGSFAVNRTFPQSIALIQSGAVQVEPLISHRLPLKDFARGLEIASNNPDRMKVQFEL